MNALYSAVSLNALRVRGCFRVRVNPTLTLLTLTLALTLTLTLTRKAANPFRQGDGRGPETREGQKACCYGFIVSVQFP